MRLPIELLPTPLWNKELRHVLGKYRWDKLVKPIKEKERFCWYCGSDETLHQWNAHEVWEYNDLEHIQKLIGIHKVCDSCHYVLHYGFSTEIPRGIDVVNRANMSQEKIIKHFCKVNNCSIKEFSEHLKEVRNIYQKRSSHQEWKQDFGEYKEYIPNLNNINITANNTQQTLEPYTMEHIKSLKGVERYAALKKYQEWQERQRQQEDKEMRNIRNRIWQKKNPEQMKKYLEKNKERVKKYQQEHKDKINAAQREYNASHKEEVNARQRKYYAINKNKINAYHKKYYAKKKMSEQINQT